MRLKTVTVMRYTSSDRWRFPKTNDGVRI